MARYRLYLVSRCADAQHTTSEHSPETCFMTYDADRWSDEDSEDTLAIQPTDQMWRAQWPRRRVTYWKETNDKKHNNNPLFSYCCEFEVSSHGPQTHPPLFILQNKYTVIIARQRINLLDLRRNAAAQHMEHMFGSTLRTYSEARMAKAQPDRYLHPE